MPIVRLIDVEDIDAPREHVHMSVLKAGGGESELEILAQQAPTKQVLKAKPPKLGAEKLTPDEQRRRFIEAAREAGASEDEAEFDASLKRIARPAKKPV